MIQIKRGFVIRKPDGKMAGSFVQPVVAIFTRPGIYPKIILRCESHWFASNSMEGFFDTRKQAEEYRHYLLKALGLAQGHNDLKERT